MTRKLTAAALSLLLLLSVGCAKPKEEDLASSEPEEVSSVQSVVSEPEPILYKNPLTGITELDAGKDMLRPVAVMINNISKAQPVQTGVGAADIVYETEVEGGITRLMAVYQDPSDVERIGSVRSARYAYIDLAMGHNAVYVHCGQDPNYAEPHLKDLNHINLLDNGSYSKYGKRISNGLSSEHTMYTFGNKLTSGLAAQFKMQNKDNDPWQSFAGEDETVTLSGGVANAVTVPFSSPQRSKFTYEAATGLYTRISNGNVRNDYLSGQAMKAKNVIILFTSISNYADGVHRKVALSGGNGYYVTNGTYTPIKWSKGSASASLKFSNTDGTPLTMSAGNTWVCIASNSVKPVFE